MIALVIAGCAAVAGCSSATSADSSYTGAERGTPTEASGDGSGTGAVGSAPASPPTSSPSQGGPQPGAPKQNARLTAGVWDDNLNYEFFGKYLQQSTGQAGLSIFTQSDREAAHARAQQRSAKQELDVSIVLDTTSSMGDEISYLQSEFDTIATTLKTKFPQTTPRFGLVVYRDHGDHYVSKATPFTTDVAVFRAALAAQEAHGGGDIPEAVPEGIAEGVGLDWRPAENVAKLMFWVADAPQHPGSEGAVTAAVTGAIQKGIHVYPVAASGTSGAAELTMRVTAQVTGGRYIFLTDDSGIGNSHAEPHIPCYVVTPLQGAIVRMAESEMKGERVEPSPSEVIRTVGAPNAGKCALQDKSEVVLY